MDLTRREFSKAAVVPLATLGSDQTFQISSGETSTDDGIQGAAILMGPDEALPTPGGDFFSGEDWQKTVYAYLYEADSGARYFITQDMDSWELRRQPDVSGSLVLDSPGVITGSGDGPTLIELPTTLYVPNLVEKYSDGIVEYVGPTDLIDTIIVTASISGANTTFEMGVSVNGLPAEDRTETSGATAGSSKPEGITLHGELQLSPGDRIGVSIENTGGTTDLTVEQLKISV